MSEHPNAVLARRLFTAFEQRDIAAVNEIIVEDAVWRFPGHSGPLAGEHRGRKAIISFLASVGTLTRGTFHFDLHDIAASDDHAVAIFTGTGSRLDGRVLNNPTALVMTVRDGQIAELQEFVWDLEHVEEFWS